MPTTENDIGFFQAAVPELKAYLLSDLLFWPLSGGPQTGGSAYPSLTLGGLLLARARLDAQIPASAGGTLVGLEREMDTSKQRWGAAWARKASWEFSSRLKQWQNFLEDYRRNPETQAGFYPHEVRLRVILALLEPDLEGKDKSLSKPLAALDSLLQVVVQGGDFVWDAALQAGFPSDPYWYLYGTLKEEND